MFSSEILHQINSVAAETSIDPAALLAVAEVESGGRAFAIVDGRDEPIIRFEGHYFDRRLSPEDRAIARQGGLSAPEAGRIANPATQAGRWRLLARAAAIDRKAAYESTSWGLGQVMGAHWAWLGFADVDALVAEARSGAAGQAWLMARYIDKAGLAPAIEARDWAGLARGYNGPGYRRNAYHLKIEAAYKRHARATGPVTAPVLRQGARGEAVRDLQISLTALGYPLEADGVYGSATATAVRRFQKEHGLATDGFLGPKTRERMDETGSPGGASWWRRLTAFLQAWLSWG